MKEALSLAEELTLMLMYLASWKESKAVSLRAKPPVKDDEDYFRRSWTGYPFDALSSLSEKGYISVARSRQPAFISPAGELTAHELLEKYGITLDGETTTK